MTSLDGLRKKYGGKYFVCTECEAVYEVDNLIDRIESEELEAVFDPEKLVDLAYKTCEECGALTLHELNDTMELSDQSESQSKPEEDASSADSESDDSNKHFSI